MAGRKPLPTPKSTAVVIDDGAVQSALEAADEQQARLEMLRPHLGDLVDRTTDRLWGEVDLLLNRTADDMLQLGQRFLALKEKLPHGDFGVELEKRGITFSTANKFMRASFKFADSANLKTIGKSKMLELAVLDQGEIDELNEGGTVAGLTLDDVECMGVLELRKALRNKSEALTEAETVIEKKNKKIDELDNKLTRKSKKAPWSQEVNDLLTGFVGGANLQLESLAAYHEGLEKLADLLDAGESDDQAEAAARTVMTEITKLHKVSNAIMELVNERIANHIVQ